MNSWNKTRLVLLAIASTLTIQTVFAVNMPASETTSTASSICPQFYGGVSIGVQRFNGTRNEVIDYAGSPGLAEAPEIIPFTTKESFSNKNGNFLGHLGCTWNIYQTPLFFGPEIYIGQGNVKRTVIKSFNDTNNLMRSLNTTIRQSTILGAFMQFGVNGIAKTRWLVMLGIEASRFEYFGMYVPRSEFALTGLRGFGPGVDYPPTQVTKSRWLSGFMWGVGIEKEIQRFRLGVDVRSIHYRDFKFSQDALNFERETLYTVIKPKNLRFSLKVSYLF